MYLLLVIYAIIIIYTYIIWNNNYWKDRNIPFIKPHLFYGSLEDTIKEKIHLGDFFKEWYRKFNDVPYFGYFNIRQPALVIRDPELVKKILIKDFNKFLNNDFTIDPHNDPIWVQNMFGQKDDIWKKIRVAWSGSMTTGKVRAMFENMKRKCENMTKYLTEHEGEPFEGRTLAAKHFTDVITSSVFAIETDSFKDPTNPYYDIAKNLDFSSFMDAITYYIFTFAPRLGNILGLRFVSKELHDKLLLVGKEVLESRQKTGLQKTNAFDSVLLNGYDSSQGGYSPLDAAGVIFGFLFDGTETSAAAFSFILYALATNPDVQEKLYLELEEAYDSNNGEFDFETIHKLEYLEMVFSECLRIYNPLILMQRICTKPCVLPPVNEKAKPFTIPVGMTVIIPMYALHMDPQYFKNPEVFDPERFNPENKANIVKGAYLAFSEGPRQCIGSRLATGQVKITLASIVKNFQIKLEPSMKDKSREIDPNIFLLRFVDNVWVTFHRRSRK